MFIFYRYSYSLVFLKKYGVWYELKRYSLLTGLVFTVLIFGFIQNIPFAHAAQGDLGSIIDTLEFDTLDGITPEIIQINGNTFAVVYESTDDDGTVAAFTISTTGDISNAILNTAVDFDTGIVSNPKIFHVTGTTYAVVYEENGSIKFDTLTISNDGTITDLTPTSFTIGSATNPEVVELSGALGATKFYALTYRTNVGAGNVATFSVTANGLTVAQVTAGTEFTSTANDIKILKVASSQKYAAAYRDSSNKGQVEIITITDNGDTITPGNILLTLNSDTAISSTSKLDFAHVTGTIYAVLWADTADAKVQTITIPDNGASITNIAISSAIDASGVPTDPVFLQTDLGVNPLNFIIAYHDTDAIKGELRSVTISTDGLTITNKDTIKFDNASPSGQSPSLAHRTGDFYAVAYKGAGADGFIRSFNLGSADITPPVTTGARTITEVSDGNTADFSKLGDQVRLTFTADEVIQTPVVTFPTLGTVTVTYDNTSGNTWTATATIPSGATQGAVTFTLDFNDLAGNSATQVTTVSDTSSVTVDLTAPTTVATLIMGETGSLNGDTDYSKTGDGVDTSLTANESLTGATITIGQETNTAMAGTNPSTGAWTDTYTLQAGDTEGTVTFSITATDRAGNQGTITQSLITDSSSVVFDKTAPTFTSAAITGNGDLNFVFSEPVLSTDVSHYVIEWPDNSVVTKTLAGSGTKTILADTAAVDAEGNDAVDFSISAGVTDRAGNALSPTVALANPRIAAVASFTQPTLTSTNTDVVLSPNTLITTITATSVSPNVNLSGLTGGAGTATFPASSITVDTANADILFPAGVVASGLPTDEIIEVSVSTKTANAAILPAGEVAGIIIELGDPNTTITFDVPVKVTLTGQAGNTPFIVTSTPTTVLVSTCADGSATVAPTLGSTDPTNTASHCAIVDGANLIIWTRHFTGVGSSSTPSSSGGGGSAGDRTNPSVSTGFAQNEFPLKYDGVNYQSYQLNSVHTAIIENGEILHATLRVYENSGAGNVQHVELYLNQFGSQILNDLTETIVIYDKQSGLKIIDPHNLIYTATVTPSESGNKAVFDFVIVFENEIPESDLLFRIWDSKRNSMQFHLSDALIVKISEQSSGIISVEPESVEPESDSESILVTPKAIPKTSELTPEDELSTKTLIGEQLSVLKKWAGYDMESASDVDVLSKFGIKGEKIPPYVKHLVKWILEDKISTEDLVNALQYFKREGVLSNSVGVRSPDVNSKIVTENFTMDKEAVDTKTPFDEKKNNFHTVDNLGNFEDQIGILRSLANNPVIQNELTISNMEFKTFASPDDLITQRDSEWQRNSKTITPFMEGLMNNESALIAKALIERHKDDPVSLNHIAITNAYGVNVIITEKTLDYKQSDEQWWDKTKANGIYIMSGSGGEENLGLYDAKISLTINDAQGNFVGMLTAVVNFEKALLD